MKFEDWQAKWIKELTSYGISLESATRAFHAYKSELKNLDTALCPQEAAKNYLGSFYGLPPRID